MSHVRTQIRAAFADALSAALSPTDYRVFASRKFARNRSPSDPAIVDIRFLNVNVDQTTMGSKRTHTGSLYIRVQRDALSSGLDDLLDADEVAITAAIEAEDFSLLLEEEPELVQVNFSDDASGQVAIGAIILRYDVEYRIDKANPEVALR